MNNDKKKTFVAYLDKFHSEKNNTDYDVIKIKLTDTYEMIVFPKSAELEIIKLFNK